MLLLIAEHNIFQLFFDAAEKKEVALCKIPTVMWMLQWKKSLGNG
jgi:hypothetical protein